MNFWNILRNNEKWRRSLEHQYPAESDRIKREPVTKEDFRTLKKLIQRNASETEIHKFLEEHKMMFGWILNQFRTGHHSFAVYSKQMIVPYVQDNNRGLIPDFIVGGENSDGWNWWIIELKSPGDKLFVDNDPIHFSQIANCGICQLLQYNSASNKYQGHLRDCLGLKDFCNPRGILLIGREDELKKNTRKQSVKKAFNDHMSKQFEIRSFDWLIRSIEGPMNYTHPGIL